MPLSGSGVSSEATNSGTITHVSIAQNATAVSVTGTLVETTLATVNIPGNSMGVNGTIRVTLIKSGTNNVNNKTFRVRYGGTTYYLDSFASAQTGQGICIIHNRNATNSQIGFGNPTASGVGNSSTAVHLTGAVDSTVDQALTITCALAVATDTGTLEGYTVEVVK